jgi:hypothetical protein
VSGDADWLVPFRVGGAPAADGGWTWGEYDAFPAKARRRPPPGCRVIVEVGCPADRCGRMLGRVDLTNDDSRNPTYAYVQWLPGGHSGVMRPVGGTEEDGTTRFSETYWFARFPLSRGGERAPEEIWFEPICLDHGPIEVTSKALWNAVETVGRRPTRIRGIIRAEDNAHL